MNPNELQSCVCFPEQADTFKSLLLLGTFSSKACWTVWTHDDDFAGASVVSSDEVQTKVFWQRQLCEKQLMNGQRRLLLFPQNPFLCGDESDRNGGEGLERQTVADFTCRSINQHVP